MKHIRLTRAVFLVCASTVLFSASMSCERKKQKGSATCDRRFGNCYKRCDQMGFERGSAEWSKCTQFCENRWVKCMSKVGAYHGQEPPRRPIESTSTAGVKHVATATPSPTEKAP